MQVVTPENFTQLVQTGKVDEFTPPVDAKAADASKAEPVRGEDGKFVAADAAIDTGSEKSDKGTAAPEKAAEKETSKAGDEPGAAESEDESDDDMPEKFRKKIGAKHRAMKEAEEFGEREFNRRRAAERRAEELAEELAKLKSKSGPAQEGKTESSDPAEPNPDDFKTVAEYARAVIKYEKALDAKADAEKAAKSSAETELERLGAAFKKQEAEVIKDFPDYRAVVEKFDPTGLPQHMAQFLIESGPRLTYHVLKLPAEERSRIEQLSPIRAIAELGKLEAKLEKPAKVDPPAKQPDVSKAPSPIKPLGGDGAVPVHKDPSAMTFQELREYERQKEAERRARR